MQTRPRVAARGLGLKKIELRLVREADSAARSYCAILAGRRGGGAGGKRRGSDHESKQGKATADHSNLADRVIGSHNVPARYVGASWRKCTF